MRIILSIVALILINSCYNVKTYNAVKTYTDNAYSGNYKDLALPALKIDYSGLITMISEHYDSLIANNKKNYLWKFVSITDYPYYCAPSLYLKKTTNVEVDTIGLDQFIDMARVAHVRIATVVWFTRPIHPTHTKTYFMNFYFYYNGQWMLEKSPVKTDIKLIQNYFICR
jgi:hypothetical protein